MKDNNKKNVNPAPTKGKSLKKRNRKKRVLKIVLISFLIFFAAVFIIGGAIFLGIAKTAPDVDLKVICTFNEPSKFYDDKGVLIDEYLTTEQREPVSYNNIPKLLRESFIAIEDERFESHNGIDFKRLIGATIGNVKSLVTGKKNFTGASTITQQLIKQKYFLQSSLDDRLSFTRKIQEMSMAVELEKKLSKEKILETYMNTIFLGGSAYGVKSAARQYFNKDLDQLTVTECAFLASCAQSPTVSFGAAKYAYDKKELHESPRTKIVLKKLLEKGKITQEQYDKAIVPQLSYSFKDTLRSKMKYEWFSRPVIEQVSADLKKRYNYTDLEVHGLLANGGLKIYTTMNTKLQNKTQEIIDDKKTEDKKSAWQYLFPRTSNLEPLQENLQASATVMDYHTGEVKAIVGGRGEQNALSYNRAASESFLRPPGSALKPFAVYTPAIDTKKFTAASMVEDEPLSTELQTKYGSDGTPYNPKNSPNTYDGMITLRNALKKSSNVVAVRVVDEVGLSTSSKYAEKFGIQIDPDDKKYISSMALGQLDTGSRNGTNPLTLSAAYGAFGNNGKVTSPVLYTKIVSREGSVLFENKAESRQVISPQTAFIVYDMLKEPVSSSGTGPSANFGSMEVRGKTGTSSDQKNLWFAGLTPHYSCAVWVGNDDATVIKGMGSNTAAKIWAKIMKEANAGKDNISVKMPKGVVVKKVSPLSGNFIKDLPIIIKGYKIYNEYFLDNTYSEPENTSEEMYVKLKVVKNSNGTYLLATDKSDPGKIEEKTFIKQQYAHLLGDNDKSLLEPTEYDTGVGTNIPPDILEPENPDDTVPGDNDVKPTKPNLPDSSVNNSPSP
ncbi:penicillin-binding protein 1A [Hathewaya proteolytica DSM 3090]|uniref:Penicillin-binding protein 1A n=1 Tax=Hathewaya proteolytica DSM 3090 TaxID=1121331 RepID=A0A1M6P9Q8_9CLOT|nr:PBP1A family penicillin-binding protein [Hathewaya proteolytica]SHK04648.1 penicillin-binding protein 1A [Hathewaya proteolytica DSM 3090]